MKQAKSKNILFFYSELAAYFLACAEALHLHHGYEVHIVHWPINPEAPFTFRSYEGVHLYEKQKHSSTELWELYQKLSPALVFCIGWMDPEYKALAKNIKAQGTPVVAGLDNHWQGTMKQHIARWISPLYLKPYFDFLWVPGAPQYTFAKKLGYSDPQILTGFYSADLDPFFHVYERFAQEKQEKYPHKFLYVGRFVEVKGVENLLLAYEKSKQAFGHDWKLELVGTGPLKERLSQHAGIEIKDFVQPEKLPSLAQSAGCFVMPSLKEPWGVVIHEFAGAGLPLLCSHACGAATTFLEESKNGFFFDAQSIPSLVAGIGRLVKQNDDELMSMSRHSHQLSKLISPETWAKTLLSTIS